MKQNGSFQETIARIGQKLRSSRKRYFGVLLILLGIVLGIVSRAVWRISVPGFHHRYPHGVSRPASFSLGSSPSCCPSSGGDDILDKASNLPKLHAEASDEDDPMSAQVV